MFVSNEIRIYFFSVIEIKPSFAEYFITLGVNNNVKREVRLLPNVGKKGGYVVQPRSMLKVQIIIKNGTAGPKTMTFTAQDLELESSLEINGKITPISVSPSESPDVVTTFNITAPGT